MMRSAFYAATYWAPTLFVLLLVIARVAAPFPYAGADYTQAMEESLVAAVKERSDSGYVYVKLDGNDPGADFLTDLNSHKLPATFAPLSLRPPYRCPANARCGALNRANLSDNVISADLLSMPLWHVALVRVKTASCSAELTLFRATQWHVVTQRTACGDHKTTLT